MMFSRSCEYALQAVIFMGSQPDNAPVLQREISKALNIPPHFLGKILQTLVHHNIVASQKGKKGGFFFKKSKNEISLHDIIMVIDGPAYLDSCILGFPGCNNDNPCPIHEEWKKSKEAIVKMLKDNSIDQLSKGIGIKLDFIKNQIQKGSLKNGFRRI